MRIIALQAENVKRLRAVSIRPDSDVVEITGRNGQGKTSVLDSIYWALAGARAHQDKPIRDGELEASVELDLGDIIVRRRFKTVVVDDEPTDQVTTQLVVESVDGERRFRSPQAMLDKLLGSLTFDPLAFSRAPAREQYETLAGFVADLDVAEFEREQEQDYDLRRRLNRDAKDATAKAKATEVPDDAPQKPVSYADLRAELREAEAANRDRERQERAKVNDRRQLEIARENQARDQVELQALHEKAERLAATVDDRGARIKAMAKALEVAPALPARVDTSAIVARLEDAAATNAKHELRERRKELDEAAAEVRTRAKAVDVRMRNRKAAMEAAVAAADMPVKGLALEGGAVLLNGVPLAQASDAEQLRLSCACAMRQNADLRVLRIRDGSLLDSASMEVLRRMAAANDYQVWIERVADEGDGMGFVITDGEVAEEPAE